MKKNYKKRFKEKIKVTLKILVLLIIIRDIGYSEENLEDTKLGIVIENKKNETTEISNIDHTANVNVEGLNIKNSENIAVDIDEIKTILKKKDGIQSNIVLFGKGLINDKSTTSMSDGLKINVIAEGNWSNTASLIGISNNENLTLGENTKVNVVVDGEVHPNSKIYGAYLNGISLTSFGKGSEINVSSTKGIIAGIVTNFTEINDEVGVVIGDNVKIRTEVTDATSGTGNRVTGIYSSTGNTVTVGDELILETEMNLSNGATGNSYGVQNANKGKLIIGSEAKITSVFNSENQMNSAYSISNTGNSILNIGKNSQISIEGTDANQIRAVHNDGSSSEVIIEDGGTMIATGENTVFVMGLSNINSGKMNIGNEVKIFSILNSEKQTNLAYSVYNTKNSVLNIGNGVKISSILNSKEQKNTAYSVYNIGNSILNVGENSQISVEGTNANQIRAVHNDGSSSEVTIGDRGTITATGENTVFVMGLYNNNGGKMNIGNETKITSITTSEKQTNSAYSVYNTGNSTLNIGKSSEINVIGKDVRQISAIYNNGASSKLIIEDESTIIASGENTKFVVGLFNENSGNIKIGDKAKIISTLDSAGQKDNVFGINNTGNSTLNIGKNSEINAVGKDAKQIVAIYNDGSSSKLTIEDGSRIAASTLGTNEVIAVIWNENGNIVLDGGTDIYSEGYAVHNEGGNVSIKDEGYSKRIQGDIESIGTGGITNILLDAKDSYLEGRSVQENGGVFNFGLKNNAVWYVPQNSEVTNFDIENGIVDMTQNRSGETIKGKQVISIDKTFGSGGTYIMDISPEDRDQTGDKTDGINIEKADAAQKNYIQAGKTSITGLANHNFSDKENSSIKIASADKNVIFEGSKFTDTASIYNYVLSLEENIQGETGEKNIWYVTGIEKEEGEVIKNIETAITLNYMNTVLSRLESDTVHKRLSEVNYGDSENGVWAGTSGGQMEHNKSSEKFKNDYKTLQIGFDKRRETEKRSVFTGFAVHKRDGKADFKNGDGKNYDIGISLYKSFVMEDNSYTNLVVKYSYINNEYKNYTKDNQKMETDYDTWSGSLSVEHGKKYEKNNWYIIPQVQMNYTFVKGADYTMNSGIKVEQKNINSLVGKTGMYAGYDFERSSHFIKIGILQEFSGDYGARITGTDTKVNKKYKGRDTWLEAGLGGYFKVGERGTTNLYYSIEKTFGSKFERNWQVGIGLRIKF